MEVNAAGLHAARIWRGIAREKKARPREERARREKFIFFLQHEG
jgi:hypothetical protein